MDHQTVARHTAAALHGFPFVTDVAELPAAGGGIGLARLTDVDGEHHLIMVVPDLPKPTPEST